MGPRHSMKVAARRSGLTPGLIRMWERRYQAVVPGRTATGRRLYSEEDINRLTLLRRATQAGESISQLATLSDTDLEALLNDIGFEEPAVRTGGTAQSPLDFVEAGMNAVRQLDETALESILLRGMSSLGQPVFLQEVVAPLLNQTGQQWAEGTLKIVHEHLLSAVVRSVLGGSLIAQQADDNRPAIVVTTPVGQHHEFGILMAALMAANAGWRAVYLGANVPAEDIAAAVTASVAPAVALSLVYPTDDPRLGMELGKLSRLLRKDTRLIVGGPALSAYDDILTGVGALRVKDLSDLKSALDSIRTSQGSVH